MEAAGIEPASPRCDRGVLPLYDAPRREMYLNGKTEIFNFFWLNEGKKTAVRCFLEKINLLMCLGIDILADYVYLRSLRAISSVG